MKNIEEITIRPVTEADAEKLLSIYAPYVTDTFITYEYTVPTVEEFRERIRNTLQAYPYFAAVENGRIIGYAYASAFHPRRAYLWSIWNAGCVGAVSAGCCMKGWRKR